MSMSVSFTKIGSRIRLVLKSVTLNDLERLNDRRPSPSVW